VTAVVPEGPRTVSLLDPEPTRQLVAALRDRLPQWAVRERTHLVLAASADEAAVVVRGGSTLQVMAAQTAFSPRRSQLRAVSVSGHPDEECGRRLLARLLEQPVQLGEELPWLHVHFADLRGAAEAGGGGGGQGGAAPPPDNSPAYTLLTPRVRLRDVELPAQVRDRVLRALAVFRRRDLLASWGVGEVPGFAGRLGGSLNLVGPSGTGKSFTAEAIAGELDRPLLRVDYARLESKYVGETSKNITAVFAAAREHGAVLFFDEADSFLGRRVQDVRQSYDTAVNSTRAVMLLELQEFAGMSLFATNLVTNYDPAFRRRILDHIEFPLPDAAARARILRAHTPRLLPGAEALDFAALGAMSQGCSGGDLANAAYQVCLALLHRWESAPGPATTEDFAAAIRASLAAQALFEGPGTSPDANEES
jgi:hypothetical protein